MSLPGFTVGELLADETPAPPLLIDPWLDVQGYGMIHAAPGVGKSMLSLAVALAVAGGGRMLGWTVPEPMPVLYIDAEMTRHRLRERVADLLPSIEGLNEGLALEQLRIVSRQDYAAENGPFPEIGDGYGEGADEIAEWVEAHGAGLVVLDNLSQLAAMQDENDAAEARKLTRFVSRLRSLGAGVIVVHHDGKGGQGGDNSFRGSSGLKDPLDVQIGLSKQAHPTGAGVAFGLGFNKHRYKTEGVSERRDIRLDTDGKSSQWLIDGGSHSKDKSASGVDELIEAAEAGQYQSQKELAEAIGWQQAKVSRTIKQAAAAKRCTKDGFLEVMKAPARTQEIDF